jgi:hypothetical protein
MSESDPVEAALADDKRDASDASRANLSPFRYAVVALGALGTLLGTISGIWSGYNSGRISQLSTQLQSTQQFAAGIHDARDVLSTDPHIRAAVEVSRLYTLAGTPEQKLVVIQVAQLAGQNESISALATLVGSDETIKSASKSDQPAVDAINRIFAQARNEVGKSPSPSPTPTLKPQSNVSLVLPAHSATPSPRPSPSPTISPSPSPLDDPPLTGSQDPSVAANAALLVSLPPAGSVEGWVFLGDIYRNATPQSTAFVPATPTTTATQAPAAGDRIFSCGDLNVRDVPFHNGQLGKPLSVLGQGTPMTVRLSDPSNAQSFLKTYDGIGTKTGKPITAIWAFVYVDPNAQPSRNACG